MKTLSEHDGTIFALWPRLHVNDNNRGDPEMQQHIDFARDTVMCGIVGLLVFWVGVMWWAGAFS